MVTHRCQLNGRKYVWNRVFLYFYRLANVEFSNNEDEAQDKSVESNWKSIKSPASFFLRLCLSSWLNGFVYVVYY